MSIKGFQEHWLAGSRMYFTQDDVNSVAQPLIDFGVIKPANPSVEPQTVELKDSDGGVNRVVDEGLFEINESYDIICNNMSLRMFAFQFLSTPPEAFTQSAAPFRVTHAAIAGHLLKVKDAAGVNIYNVNIRGISKGTITGADAFTAINATTGVITTAGDTATAGLGVGESFIIESTGLANIANAGTYIVTAVDAATITVGPNQFVANEAAITGSLVFALTAETVAGAKIGVVGTDFAVPSVGNARGILQYAPAGALTDGDIEVYYDTVALSGDRLIKPQAGSSSVTGQMLLVWGRDNFDKQTVREARVSITPSSTNVQNEDFSEMTLTVTVLSDVTEADSAGRMLQFKGDVPSKS